MTWLEAVRPHSFYFDVLYFKILCACNKLTAKISKLFCVKVKLELYIVAVVSQTVFHNDENSLRRLVTYVNIIKHIFAF